MGAFPGAVPPLIGWTAARDSLSLEGWVLFAILFLWQFPHFLAIAWMYREDYSRAGILMLPVVEPNGRVTAQQIVVYTLMLLPVSLLPFALGMSGRIYLYGAIVLGLLFLYSSLARGILNVAATSAQVAVGISSLFATSVYLDGFELGKCPGAQFGRGYRTPKGDVTDGTSSCGYYLDHNTAVSRSFLQ